MYTPRSQKVKRLDFNKYNDLKSIQDFVLTKIYNPDYIERLKDKQLSKIQVKKIQISTKNLTAQIRKQHEILQKTKQDRELLFSYKANKNNDFLKIESKLEYLQTQISEIEKQRKGQEKIKEKLRIQKLRKLQDQNNKITKNFNNDMQSKLVILSSQKQKVQIIERKNQQLKKKIQFTKNLMKVETQKRKSKFQNIQKININLLNIDSTKQKILQQIKRLQSQKQKLIHVFKQKKSLALFEKKAEEECIMKLGKFVNQLKIIVENPKSSFQQKKNLLDILMNVYCSDQKSMKSLDNLSKKQIKKDKHDSLQTNSSLSQEYPVSDQNIKSPLNLEIQNFGQDKSCSIQIPFTILHSLRELQKKNKIDKVLEKILNQYNPPGSPLRKLSSPRSKRVNQAIIAQNRNSLPNSLDKKGFRDLFGKEFEQQNNYLEGEADKLEKQQKQIDEQIRLLKQKCNKKDIQINEIISQHRKSKGKQK